MNKSSLQLQLYYKLQNGVLTKLRDNFCMP